MTLQNWTPVSILLHFGQREEAFMKLRKQLRPWLPMIDWDTLQITTTLQYIFYLKPKRCMSLKKSKIATNQQYKSWKVQLVHLEWYSEQCVFQKSSQSTHLVGFPLGNGLHWWAVKLIGTNKSTSGLEAHTHFRQDDFSQRKLISICFKLYMTSQMQFNLSRVRKAPMRLLSKAMPRNSIAWSGPDFFSSDKWIPNFAKVSLRAEMRQSGFEFG